MANKKREWTPEEDAAIRSYPEKGIHQLSRELKTSDICVKRRLGELGIPIRKPGRPKPHSLPARSESDFGSDQHYYGTDMVTD